MKLLLLLFSVLFTFQDTVAQTTAQVPCFTDQGNQVITYYITNLAELRWLSEVASTEVKENVHGTWLLMSDIDAAETKWWNDGRGFMPINAFRGDFLAQGYTIDSLYMRDGGVDTPIGLFGYQINNTSGGGGILIKDLRLSNCDIYGQNSAKVAGIYADMNYGGMIQNCSVQGRILGHNHIGGITAFVRSNATVENCLVRAQVTKYTGDLNLGNAGGIIGSSTGLSYASNCFFIGTSKAAIISNNSGTLTASNCYYDSDSSVLNTNTMAVGNSLSHSESLDPSNYTGWDFDYLWYIAKDGYPQLWGPQHTTWTSDFQFSPDWLIKSRFQLHTLLAIASVGPLREDRLGITGSNPEAYGEDQWFSLPQYVAKMGASVYTRHFRSGGEAAIWPTKNGLIHAINNDYPSPDMAQRFIDDSHHCGTHVIAYYRHDVDQEYDQQDSIDNGVDYLAYAYPQLRDSSSRGAYMSLVSPYADRYIERIKELTHKGVSAFYFDEDHMPFDRNGTASRVGDYSSWSKEKYAEWNNGASLVDADRDHQLSHRQAIMEYFFSRLQDSIRMINPYAKTLVSSSDQQIKSFHIYDYVKSEPNFWTSLQSVGAYSISDGLSILRDATEGRAPHIWLSTNYSNMPLASMTRFLAYGAIFNRHTSIDILAAQDELMLPLWQEQADMAFRISPYMANQLPYNHTLIHIDELQQQHQRGVSDNFVNAFYTLKDHGIPGGLILDHQIASGIPTHCQVLILPEWTSADVPLYLQSEISRFITDGGTIIYSNQLTGSKTTTEDNAWFNTIGVPVFTTGGVATSDFASRNAGANQAIDDFLDVVCFREPGTAHRVINLSNGPQSGIQLFVADSIINENSIVYEVVSNTLLQVHNESNGFCRVVIPDFESLATIIIDETPVERATNLVYVDQTDDEVTYYGKWLEVEDEHAFGGSIAELVQWPTNTSTEAVSFTFKGTHAQVGIKKSLLGGFYKIFLDGELVADFVSGQTNSTDNVLDDVYNQYLIYNNPFLSPEEHTIELQVTVDNKSAVIPDAGRINVDFFAYRPIGELVDNNTTASTEGSIAKVQGSDISVYPIPASNTLHISVNESFDLLEAKFYSVTGHIVLVEHLHSVVSGHETPLSTKDLSTGIYYVVFKGLTRSGESFSRGVRISKN